MSALSLRINTRAELTQAIVTLSLSPDTRHRVPLLQALHRGQIAFLEVERAGCNTKVKTFMRLVDRPALILLGDDDDAPTGPAKWPVAERVLRWARAILIHGTGGEPEHYEAAVTATEAAGRMAVIETSTAMTGQWVKAARRWAPKAAVQVREVLPGGAPHPVAATLGQRH